jgi:hypothetical protein
MSWVYAGQLAASVTLLPAEAAYQTFIDQAAAPPAPVAPAAAGGSGPAAARFLSLDRFDWLRYHVLGAGYRAMAMDSGGSRAGGGEGDDTVSLVSADNDPSLTGNLGDSALMVPGWLALGTLADRRLLEASPMAPLAGNSPFSRLRARVVIYRGYDLFTPDGSTVATQLRVRVEGNGVDEEDGLGFTFTAGMDSIASAALRLADGPVDGGDGGESGAGGGGGGDGGGDGGGGSGGDGGGGEKFIMMPPRGRIRAPHHHDGGRVARGR